jgi:hypothetical protein
MIESYNKKKEQIEQSNILNKEEELKKIKTEVVKEMDKSIKGSVGVSIPGLPVGINAAIEYTIRKIY